MPLQALITIGYEGADAASLLATLQRLRVDLLLDVREMAMSRRKGFAKTALREGLASVGIEYRHEPRLGSPRAVRHRLREDGDYERFFAEFDAHLEDQHSLLRDLSTQLHGTVALLCYERDHCTCHRSAVASALGVLTGIAARHHGVEAHGPRTVVVGSRTHPRQGVSAA